MQKSFRMIISLSLSLSLFAFRHSFNNKSFNLCFYSIYTGSVLRWSSREAAAALHRATYNIIIIIITIVIMIIIITVVISIFLSIVRAIKVQYTYCLH